MEAEEKPETLDHIAAGTGIQADDTLIILDERQEAPKAMTSLKYFL